MVLVTNIPPLPLAQQRQHAWLANVANIAVPVLILWLLWVLNFVRRLHQQRLAEELERTRQQVREANVLLKSQERIRRLIDANLDGFLIMSNSGEILIANPALEALLGYTSGSLSGQPLSCLLPGCTLGGLPSLVTYGQRSERIGHGGNLLARHKDGTAIPVELVFTALTPQDNTEIAATVVDLRERLQQERQIRTFALAFSSAVGPMLIADADFRVQYVNQAFQELTGYGEDQLIGSSISNFLMEDHASGQFNLDEWHHKTLSRWSGRQFVRHHSGQLLPVSLGVNKAFLESGQQDYIVMSLLDLSQLEEAHKRLQRLALHDSLTGLPNRAALQQTAETAIARARRRQKRVALLFIDLDNFKLVNDGAGHEAGDHLLIRVGELLRGVLREEDAVARLGGDEFVVLLEGIESTQALVNVCHKVLKVLDLPCDIRGETIQVSASIGVCQYPDDGADFPTLLHQADLAMYQAKQAGKSCFYLFNQDTEREASELLRQDLELRRAIRNDELFLLYQPQVNLTANTIAGVEVLVRWAHPQLGVLSPSDFLPLAERSGLLGAVENRVFRAACQQARAWLDAGLAFGRMAINLSGARLLSANLAQELEDILRETNCPATVLEVEITEAFINQSSAALLSQMQQLHDLGVSICVDHFGSGYSSLSYLKDMPIDKLKLGPPFVTDIGFDINSQRVVSTMIAMARGLNLVVAAECVESRQQSSFLATRQCTHVQGFYYYPPLSEAELEQCLRENSENAPYWSI